MFLRSWWYTLSLTDHYGVWFVNLKTVNENPDLSVAYYYPIKDYLIFWQVVLSQPELPSTMDILVWNFIQSSSMTQINYHKYRINNNNRTGSLRTFYCLENSWFQTIWLNTALHSTIVWECSSSLYYRSTIVWEYSSSLYYRSIITRKQNDSTNV